MRLDHARETRPSPHGYGIQPGAESAFACDPVVVDVALMADVTLMRASGRGDYPQDAAPQPSTCPSEV